MLERNALTPADLVDPLIDSASSRWIFFSSACRPFGMVNLSPDTDIDGAWNSSYLYHSETICGFSHVHAWQMAGILVMPTTGEFLGGHPEGHRSRFSHDDEDCRAGYHSVYLEDFGIQAELTSTDRVGLHRYTFPESRNSDILFSLGYELGPTDIQTASARRVSDCEIEGCVVNALTRRRPRPVCIHFVARFSKPFETFGGWDESGTEQATNEISGPKTGAFARFTTANGEQITVKVALSYVSAENARANLEAECPHWDFDRVKDESRAVWNDCLSKIEIEGGTPQQQVKFYTDLWHGLLGRRLVSDVDGSYIDNTGAEPVRRHVPLDTEGKPRYAHYNSDAFWGAQWTINTVWPLVCPDHVREMCNCLIDYYKNGGLIPRGPTGGNYSFVMTGASSTPFLVNAYMKGIRDFDIEAAYEGMRKNAFPGGLMSKAGYEHDTCLGGGLEYYLDRGYVPDGRKAPGFHICGAGQTLEYAYQDWCLAQLAKALGKDDDYALFMERAHNYRNLFDAGTGFMRPRNLDGGEWLEPFDPLSGVGFVEANAWQDTWFVPHDINGLAQLFGSSDALCAKLNEAFEEAEPHNFSQTALEKEKKHTTINYGNQPSTQTAHVFNYAGKPWLSQKWVREVKEKTQGGTTPDLGYRGDEDQGLMGSLGVLMAIGLFQLRGGADEDPVYEITSPLFDRVTIHLDPDYYDGETFVIRTVNNAAGNVYIQSATLNGKPLERCWFRHSNLAGGGELVIELGPEPDTAWGSRPEDAPPSMTV